ncbi:hypothetical protein BZA70DRAFT_278595 [Myxozyma melibiosi]|uniref:LIM zinc-binding domain-containing protein n=1 Tax=Myxozyma melibiosi TaxID=54550 RepID=A0ABR1F707_9ASCO
MDEYEACSPSPMDVDGGYSSSDEEMHFSSKVRILSQLQMTLTPSNPEFPHHTLSTIPDEPDNAGALSDVSDEDIPSTPALNISSRRPWGDDRELQADESKPSRKSKKKHTCTACNKLIEGRSIRAPRDGSAPRSKHRWHKECFRCTVCQAPFDGLECYLSSDTRMPFCGACYHTRNGSLCCICGSGVEGPCVLVEEDDDEQYFTRKSHTDCFKCSECSIILNKSYYEMQRGEFMCEVHAIQTYNKLRARAFVSKGLPMSAQAVVSAQKRMSRIERRLTSTVVNIDPNQFNSGVPF